MKNLFLIIILFFISFKASASLTGKALICDNDKRGYNFISKNEVELSGIVSKKLTMFYFTYLYEVVEHFIFIQQHLTDWDKEKGLTPRPIQWIKRKTLDVESLEFINGDWKTEYLWTCEVVLPNQLNIRINNKLNKLMKASGNKL